MPNFTNYRKSISQELISTKDRVRDFIDNRHWGEDGRYKEIILAEKIKQLSPEAVSIGTGFVMCENNETTSQLDIIIYRNDVPLFFKKESFVIVPKESVLGIVEVKTKLNSSNVRGAIEKAHINGQLIGNHIFNGIFSYEEGFRFDEDLNETLSESLRKYSGFINNIAFGKDYFMKFWQPPSPSRSNKYAHYSFYEIVDLAFGYFISNLIEDVHIQISNTQLPRTLTQALYPIEEGKEAHRLNAFEIVIQ